MNSTVKTPVVSVSTTPKVVPVLTRTYTLLHVPTDTPKGKQRQIVLSILQRESRPMTISEVSSIWTSEFLHINTPIDGVTNSVRYHLHHLTLTGVTSYK